MKSSEYLEKALATFGPNGVYWAKGRGIISPAPPLYCVQSAIIRSTISLDKKVFHTSLESAREYLFSVLGAQCLSDSIPRIYSLSDWNDNPKTTWANVKDLFEGAIRRAKQDEQEQNDDI